MKLKIKPVEKNELSTLKKELKDAPHTHRYNQQINEDTLWLIGWINDKPISHVQLRFDGDLVKKVQDNLKNCPHLSNLGVKESMRRKGIASKMMKHAENLAKKKGFKKMGISVEYGNKFLIGIYNRRGYKDWGKGTITDTWKEGRKWKRKKCLHLVKVLR